MINEKALETDASWLRKTLDEKGKDGINTKAGKRTEEWAAGPPSSARRCHRWERGELSSALQILLTRLGHQKGRERKESHSPALSMVLMSPALAFLRGQGWLPRQH